MLSGLSAFPLTPMNETGVDETAFTALIRRLASANVDSIGALGSTGSYAYLDRSERKRVAELAVQHAGGVPVMTGIGALRTRDVLHYAEDAQTAGASAVLLAPMSYQPLTRDEVYGLYSQVVKHLSVPLCVYDNPRTTHFEFDDELYGAIAELPQVASIKIPGVPTDPNTASARIKRLRTLLPSRVSIGVSGDAHAATGLNAGCDAWYSVIGGLFPDTALAITRAAQRGNAAEATRLSQHLQPLWRAFEQHEGSIRVMATAAGILGLAGHNSLPLPLTALDGEARGELEQLLAGLGLVA
jgi:4-hydroxy-tetrahydrodipicolinate synthase